MSNLLMWQYGAFPAQGMAFLQVFTMALDIIRKLGATNIASSRIWLRSRPIAMILKLWLDEDWTMMNLQDPLTDREEEILACLVEGLSNAEIAKRLHLALQTVKWYNSQIYSKLGVNNRREAAAQATASGLLQAAPATEIVKHNLPAQTTPFIGREQELAELAHLFANQQIRLITVLAPGGMGKTRLVLALAGRFITPPQPLPEASRRGFRDGIFFVPLQPLSEPQHIVSQIANSMGFQFMGDSREPKQQLLDYLAQKQVLLLMDNWEHLLEGASLITDMLRAAPNLRVLATSREKLNLSGETIYSLKGMVFPTWETPQDALEYDAVRLLVQAAQRIKPDWVVTANNLDYVARVCRLTQGMPLGIVLAASWLDTLSLQDIADEIQQNVDFLATEMRDTPARQHSIRAIFDYSWHKLKPEEQQVFMKLSVFRGGFTRQAAQAVADTNARILQALVNKALVTRDNAGRYDVHELLRQYAEVHLEQSDEFDSVHAAHSAYFLEWLASLEMDIKGKRQAAALEEVEPDFENVRAAWDWAVKQRNVTLIHDATEGIFLYCLMQGISQEAQMMMGRASHNLDHNPDHERTCVHLTLFHELLFAYQPAVQPITHEELTHCLNITRQYQDGDDEAICWLVFGLKGWTDEPDFQQATIYLQQALDYFTTTDNRFYQAIALSLLSYSVRSLGNTAQALKLTQQSIMLQREIGDEATPGLNLNNLGAVYIMLDAYEQGQQTFMEAIALPQQQKNKHNLSWSNAFLGLSYFLGGAFDEARYFAEKGEQLGHEVGYLDTLGITLTTLSLLASRDAEYVRAEALGRRALIYAEKSNPFVVPFARCSLGLALCGLARTREAVATLQPLLKLTWTRNTIPLQGMVIAAVAVHMYATQALEQATRYVSFVLNADYKTFRWAKKWSLLQQLQEDLQAQMEEATFNTCWEEGRRMSLDEIMEQVLRDII